MQGWDCPRAPPGRGQTSTPVHMPVPALGKGTVRNPPTERTKLVLRTGAKVARNAAASSYKQARRSRDGIQT